MWTNDFDWMRNSQKLDSNLKKNIMKSYSNMRGVPCFLQKLWFKQNNKRTKFKVLLTVDERSSTKEKEELEKYICDKGCKIERKYKNLDFYKADLNIDAIKGLIDKKQIVKICEDQKFKALLDVAVPTIGSPLLWQQKITGKGINVAVLDTGVYSHPDLTNPKNRLIGWVDLVKGKNRPYDDNGHGTHVAGCIAGNGAASDGKYRGPAYDANIIGIKVLNKLGSGSLSTVVEGIDWCLDQGREIDIMCLSLGAPATLNSNEDPVCIAVKKAWEKGIVVCVAAGNEGPASRTVGTPGIQADVITVGATDDNNTEDRSDDVIADYSSRGPTIEGIIKPNLVAPGTGIISLHSPRAFVGKKIMRESRVGNWYIEMSGTSMATPIVAGVAAKILAIRPDYSPDQVKKTLLELTENMGVGPNQQGRGYLNLTSEIDDMLLEVTKKDIV
ncbi:serine protease AprX [Desulfitispora alkaliphila]|uniref:S8 family peptidase n=1 Tax=Desulfitispora alkaliphila TaxID=622674 RepID=UPI003D1A7AAE